jgi:hypothetical protein
MFIRSSTAINDCLIALDSIYSISKTDGIFKASTSKIPPFQKGWFIEIIGKLNYNLLN